MNIAIVPTLRLKFIKHLSEEDNRQLVHEAERYGGQLGYSIMTRPEGEITETLLVFESLEKLAEFKNTVKKNGSKVKPSLMLSYDRKNNNNSPEKIGQKLKVFAYFFGGEPRVMRFSEETGSIILVFCSNYMCKAYAKCMKLL